MCEECRRFPCHPSCPNADEETPVYYCDSCSEGIYAGDEYYPLFDERYCVDCIEDQKRTAEEIE